MNTARSKGFTLIELLVVIAIIGILSSIVLASLNSARSKGKDAALKEGVTQWANLFALNYVEYGSYDQLRSGWVSLQGACDAPSKFGGVYASQAADICADLYAKAGDIVVGGTQRLLVTGPGDGSAYSIMVALNNGKWYCSGSSGRKGEYASYSGQPGCNDNP